MQIFNSKKNIYFGNIEIECINKYIKNDDKNYSIYFDINDYYKIVIILIERDNIYYTQSFYKENSLDYYYPIFQYETITNHELLIYPVQSICYKKGLFFDNTIILKIINSLNLTFDLKELIKSYLITDLIPKNCKFFIKSKDNYKRNQIFIEDYYNLEIPTNNTFGLYINLY